MEIEFTPNMERAKDFPPIPVKFNLPDWYKEMDSYIDGIKDSASFRVATKNASPLTVKRCIPVSDYMTSGYQLTTFTDILFSQDITSNPRGYEWSIPPGEFPNYVVGNHPNSQCPIKFEGQNRHYIKLYSGWRIKTPPGYSCMFYQNFYLQEDRFVMFPAIVDTDTYDGTVGFIGYIKTDSEHIKISAGTPLVTVFPFKRDDWNMKINSEVIHDTKTNSGVKFRQYFENIYRNFFHSKKRFD